MSEDRERGVKLLTSNLSNKLIQSVIEKASALSYTVIKLSENYLYIRKGNDPWRFIK